LLPAAARAAGAPPAAVEPAAIAAEVAALQAKALEGERQWLEQQLAGFAGRLEQSVAGIGKAQPADTLDARFNLLESNLAKALDGAARNADFAGLKSIETQVEDLAAQLVAVQTHFSRLDTIELELKALADRMTSEGFAQIIASSAPKAPDSEAIAGAVASRVAQEMPRIERTLQSIASQLSTDRIAGLIAQSRPSAPAGVIAKLVADQVAQHLPHAPAGAGSLPQIDELREMIQSLTDERRHGEEQTSTMLDTMQQAMIRLLDRMDAIEQAQFAEHDMQATGQPEYPQPYRDISNEPAATTPELRQRGPAPESRPQPMAAPAAGEAPHTPAPAAASPLVAGSPRAEPQHDAGPKAGSREDYIAAARRAARMAADTSATTADEAAPEPAPRKSLIMAALPKGRRQLSTAATAMACLVLVGVSFFVVK
jgi:localization factor PodJL